MATTIAFFDTTSKEKSSFEHYFIGSKYKLLFFHEEINKVPAYEYKEAKVISVSSSSNVDEAAIAHMPSLGFVACRSTGVDNVDLRACKQKAVVVSNVPAYGQTTVAEYTILLMLMLARKMPAVLSSVKDGQIDYRKLTGSTLSGKILGVVGTGKIGLRVISIAKAMGMHAIAYDPYPDENAAKQLGFSLVTMPELLRGSDYISLHAPLNPSTKQLINSKSLALMSPHSVLINTARGQLVNTSDLIEALRSKQIAGAGLDVVEGERALDLDIETDLYLGNKKAPYDIAELDILSKMNNVILSPHNAFNSTEALAIIRKTTATNILGFLSGQLQNIIKTN